MESSWWQRLEQELEQQFDRFLSDHPNQKELLDQEHWNEQQRRKHQRLLGIDQEAQDLRQRLLKLSKDISAWSERVKRARTAGAHDLASRAESHLSHLMGTRAGPVASPGLIGRGSKPTQARSSHSPATTEIKA